MADLGQQYETKWCHEWLATFHIYRHKHFSVYHIRRGMLSLSSQVGLPWFIPPRGILWCVGPHPKFISGSLSRYIIVWKLEFWGP